MQPEVMFFMFGMILITIKAVVLWRDIDDDD